MDERPRLPASGIEKELLAELRKLPALRNTRSVTILPYSGPEGWTWKLDRIEPEVGPNKQFAFAAWRPSSVSCSSNTTSI
jgi:hypothetical protein